MKGNGGTTGGVVIPIAGFLSWGYLIVGETLTLVDPGAPWVVDRALELARERLGEGHPPITRLTATHWHVDHVGGLRYAIKKTGAQVVLSQGCAYHVRDGQRIIFPAWGTFIGMLTNRRDMDFQGAASFKVVLEMDRVGLPLSKPPRPPIEVAAWLSHGDALPGHPGWRVLETPGHTNDSVTFWHEESGTAITGDNVLGGRDAPFVNRFRWSDEALSASVARLRSMPVRRLLPGHGILHEGENLLRDLRMT